MTALFLKLKHRLPLLWKAIEFFNGLLAGMLFRHIKRTAVEILARKTDIQYEFSLVEDVDLPCLSEFLQSQLPERTAYFKPHGFDVKTLKRILKNQGYLLMKITPTNDNGSMAGYFFLRIFFTGKAFHGLITGTGYEGRGLGTTMWNTSAQICRANRLKMMATISSANKASIISAANGCRITVEERLPDNYILIRCEPKEEV